MLLRRMDARLVALTIFMLAGIACSVPAIAIAVAAQVQRTQVERNLQAAGQVWALVKYRHPQVTRCVVDWDAALLQRLAPIEAAGTDADRDALLLAMVLSAGPIGDLEPTAATPAWIRNGAFAPGLQLKLAALAAATPAGQCYVRRTERDSADFAVDQGSASAALTRPLKILAAFRFWGAIEYFFPYKSDIGRDWADVLAEHVLPIANTGSLAQYTFAMRRFTAEIQDTHSFLFSASVAVSPNELPPFRVKRIGERFYVDRTLVQAGTVRTGDELLKVNGRSFGELVQERGPLASGSNPAAKDLLSVTEAASGFNPGTSAFEFLRADGSQYSASLPVLAAYYQPLLEGAAPAWRTEALGQCQMGVVNMSRLQPADVVPALASLSTTDAIVFDLRGYPNGVVYELVDRLVPSERVLVLFDLPDFQNPGSFFRAGINYGGGQFNGYRGRILLLLDEQSISQSEFTAMLLQATDNSISFGSQTSGADGDVTQVYLPGGVQNFFSGFGIYYPDGRATQRVGIVPDVHVYPTVEGLRAGRDEVLEAALDCRWLAQVPKRRDPAAGIYGDPTRSGEGVELHKVGDSFAVVHYGYDNEGGSDWVLGIAQPSQGDDFLASLDRFGLPAGPSAVGELRLNQHVGAYRPACAIADQTAIHQRVGFEATIDEGGLSQCLESVFSSAGSPLSGAWAGPEDDRGWGLGIHRNGDTLAVALYAYDSEGRPRWALGVAPIDPDGSATLTMSTFAGFCRQCPAQTVTERAAGTIELQLSDDGRGIATIDVEIDPGSFWQRSDLPISLLSSPN